MGALLKLSAGIDKLNELIGKIVMWLVLAAVVISAGNASLRKAFNVGSNAWLEIQWYLFAGVFMLGVGYVMLKNAHVRIDFISSKLSKRTNAIIDAIGIVVFTIPLSIILISLSWPLFQGALASGEIEIQASVFRQRQGVHVAAQQHGGARLASVEQCGDSTGGLVQGHIERQTVQGLQHVLAGDR